MYTFLIVLTNYNALIIYGSSISFSLSYQELDTAVQSIVRRLSLGFASFLYVTAFQESRQTS